MNIDQEFYASLTRLANNIGPEVLSIDLVIDPKAHYVAQTNADGIWISSNVVNAEPQNVEVYMAHEIAHHVIGDPEQTSKFPPYIVNLAEDYKINQMIEELFGYDVLKVGVKGLRDKRFDSMSVREVALTLTKENVTSYDHYAQRLPSREILAAAQVWKDRYKVGKRKTFFAMDGIDKDRFVQTIEPAIHKMMRTHYIRNIDVHATLQSMWAHLYLPSVVHTMKEATRRVALRPSQALAYCIDAPHFRSFTMNDPVRSALTTGHILRALDLDAVWINEKLRRVADRMEKMKEELSHRDVKRRRKSFRKTSTKKLKRRLGRAHLEAIRLANMVPLHKLLEDTKVIVKPGKKVRMPTLALAQEQLEQGNVRMPLIEHGDLEARIYRASRRAGKKIAEYVEASEQVRQQLKGLLNIQGEEPVKGAGSEAGIGGEDGDGDDDSGQGQGPAKIGDGGGSPSPRPSQQEAAGEPGKKPNIRMAGSPSSGEGRGGDSALEHKLTVETLVFNNSGRLLRIVQMMREIESELSSKPAKRTDDNPTLPVGLSYGDDLGNVDASEFALLANEATKMDFYVRLSQGSLLQRSPLERRQGAVVICIDTSGSMMGGRLEQAIAFTLAFANRLAKQGRGLSLVLFHDQVYFTVNFKDKPSLIKLLSAFTKLRSGGTNFQLPIMKAWDIRDENKWKETAVILVSDGEGSFDDPVEIKKRIGKKDRMQAILIGRAKFDDHETSEQFHDIYNIKANHLVMTLINVARNIL